MYVFTPNSIILSSQVNYNFDELFNGRNTCPYKFYASISGAQNVADNVATQVVLDSTTFDPNSDFDIGANRYTVPVTGYYLISFSLYCYNASNTGGSLQGYIKIGDTQAMLDYSYPTASNNNVRTGLNNTAVLFLTAGDLITLWSLQNNLGGQSSVQQAYLTGHLISV